MKKTLILLACTFVVGAFAAVAAESPPAPTAEPPSAAGPAPIDVPDAGLFTPAPQPTDPCHRCLGPIRTTSPGGGAASHWGKGSSCGAAENDASNQLWSAAAGICVGEGALGACSLTVVYTATCFWNGSEYQVDVYADFKCMEYLC